MQKSSNIVKTKKNIATNNKTFGVVNDGKTHIIEAIKALESDDLTILLDENLDKYSTMRVGGVAGAVALPKSFTAFLRVLDVVKQKRLPYYILGNGSNTLCSSKGFDGVVICTRFMNKISLQSNVHKRVHYKKDTICNGKNTKKRENNAFILQNKINFQKNFNLQTKQNLNDNGILPKCGLLKKTTLTIFAECGALLPQISKRVCDLGYAGFEFACGIPASCGGAVKMNAGAFGGQIADIVSRVLIFNTKTCSIYYKINEKNIKKYDFLRKKCKKYAKCVQNADFLQNELDLTNGCDFCLENNFCESYKADYRKTNIDDCEFIIGAELIFQRGHKADIQKKRAENIKNRIATQNVGYPSLGSVFKRSGDFIPSAFIDKSGLKGLTLGGAQVSKVHAGYIVNRGNATSDDILKLLKFLQNYICKKSNIVVQYELKFLGDHNEEKQKFC